MLFMVEECIKGRICHSVYWYAKVNNKYMKNFDWSKEPPYFQYWDVNNLHIWIVSQKLSVNNFEWAKDTFQLNEDFIKHYNEESDKGYFLEVDFQYIEKLHELHNVLQFLPERIKIKKVEKHETSLHDITEYFVHMGNLKIDALFSSTKG